MVKPGESVGKCSKPGADPSRWGWISYRVSTPGESGQKKTLTPPIKGLG